MVNKHSNIFMLLNVLSRELSLSLNSFSICPLMHQQMSKHSYINLYIAMKDMDYSIFIEANSYK